MTVFEKIKAQQPKERTPVWMVGEQLADMIREDPLAQELVDKDLDVEEMSLAACEKKIKEYADKHKTGNFACVIPAEAERIIREFYGIPSPAAQQAAPPEREKSGPIDLASFF